MKGGFLQRIQGRIKIGLGVSIIAFVGLSTSLQQGTGSIKDIANLQEGMQTCFTRVHNTLTARLMGSLESRYLSKGFTGLTEECFGETVSVYESLSLNSMAALDNLNKLASDVHWFHEKALNNVSGNTLTGENPENVIISLVSGRYEKLEILRDKAVDQLNSQKAVIAKKQASLGQAFYIIMFIIPFLAVVDWLVSRRTSTKIVSREKAGQEIIENDDATLDNVAPLVQSVLKETGHGNLSQAFDMARTRSEKKTSNSTIQIPTPSVSEKQIDELWEQSDNLVTPNEVVSVESVLGSVIDHVSPKIFTSGITIDIESETAFVDSDREALEQTFYHIVMSSINSFSKEESNKYLSITMRKLGGTLIVDFFDSGREYTSRFLKSAAGLGSDDSAGPEINVAIELSKELGGRLTFENMTSDDGQKVIGRKVQLSMPMAKKSRKLTSVEKGTKKELLERMKRS